MSGIDKSDEFQKSVTKLVDDMIKLGYVVPTTPGRYSLGSRPPSDADEEYIRFYEFLGAKIMANDFKTAMEEDG